MKRTIRQPALLYASLALCLTFYATYAPAGECLPDCMRAHNCWNMYGGMSQAYCSGILPSCQMNCRQSSQGESFGAIAYSAKDKGAGWSFGWNSESKAEQVALDNCSKHGSQCKVLVWYRNSCGAVAADGDIVAWGQASAKRTAEQSALDKCGKAGGKKCAIETAQCSRR